MPFDETRAADLAPYDADYSMQQQVGAPADAAGAGILSTAGAAFRQSNLIGSILSSDSLYQKATGKFYEIDPSFQPFAADNIAGYEDHADRFTNVFNKQAMSAVKADIDQETADRKTLAQSGWKGLGLSVVAGVTDPTILLPGGALVRSGKAGYSAGRSALNTALAAGGAAVAQEIGLQSSQQLRTETETFANIGGSVILGGALGGSVAALMSKLEHSVASRALDAAKAPDFDQATNALHAELIRQASPQSAGAAGVVPETLDDLSIAGRAASKAAKATAQLNPLLRTLHSPSVAVRQIGSQMMENPIYLRKNMAGEGDIAAETSMHEFTRGGVAQAVEAQRAAYASARKDGLALTESDFHKAVGRAMRRGDKSDIPGVSEAATAWRNSVVEPLKKRAIETGLLPADVEVATAESYFTRMWNRPVIEANEREFKDILRNYFDGQVSAAMQREAANSEKAISSLESVRADLNTGIANRQAGIAKLAQGVAQYIPDEMLQSVEAGFQRIAGGIARDMDAVDLGKVAKVERQISDYNSRGQFEFLDDADRADYVSGIVDDLYDMLTGRAQDGFLPPNFTVAARGPLKERTFNIPDALVEKFLEDNVDLVGRRYARVMAADTELAERFGSPDMKEAFERVRIEYAELRAQAGNDPKAVKRLNQRERADIRDLQAVRDMLRGNYRADIQHTGWARILAGAGAFNYMRSMGGVLIGSLTDAVRPAMVHGLTSYLKDGIGPMVRGVKAAGLSKKEAQLAGAISEKILASRMASMAELTDPYAANSPFERFLENMTTGFTRMTGLLHWDDFQKTLSSRMVQNRILANAETAARSGFSSLPAKERAYMGYLGIGGQKAEDIGRLYASHGEASEGVRVANTEAWGDEPISAAARRAYRAAINKDVDSIIVTKGVGDVPLFASTPVGRAILQFKSFSIASNQRVLIRGLQEDKSRLVGGIVGMATIGAFVYALKQIEAGRELSDNPGTWAMEGLDRSGIFAIGFEANNALEKLGVPGLYVGASALFPNSSQKQPASRYATRSVVGGLLGPTYELSSDAISLAGLGIANAKGAVTGDAPGMAESDVSTMRRLTPFASLPYWRWLIDGMLVPEVKEAVRH
ncbi:hypothetical protein SAMN05216358_2622 [Rhizobium sp. AN5]|uniref:hypothetical protein n=1 Tax=Rhizobium sp. AN5 TaxID=1855304 RepID=UPI000BCE22B4|nr:hypothetical protein [Rhizobium sp. AN5]SOC92471.1 hypothetical protein SAMN05216358_2622 [Rhizobium sp. AN5]